ncbi:MAG: ABC transporter permease [Chitinophagaceae bacterium]
MLRNYFKIALRQLRKQKMYSAIKIGGFALSIAACLLIALYIKDELSYDKAWENADRIYRITGSFDNNGKIETGADWPAPMAKALKEDYPEVEMSGRLMPHPLFYGAGSNQILVADKQQNTYEDKFTYADQSMLEILKVKMVYGERSRALAEPNTIVLTKSKADKYFPNQNPVGKIMILNDDQSKPFRVGGVIEDFPTTSHIEYKFLLTLTGHKFWDDEQTTWMASNYYTYVLLKPGTNAAQFEAKLKNILTKYYVPVLKAEGQKLADDLPKKAKVLIQPITDIHLGSRKVDDELGKGDTRIVWMFGGIACFILIIACINFINLSTAKSANRAKEVGLRKVVGSYRSGLVQQFLTESMLYSVLSFILGIGIAALLLPYFNVLSAKSLTFPWTAWWLLPLMIIAAVIIGIVAGLYPSFYLSSFKPISVLKGQLSQGSKNSLLRNSLVVFQFTTSIILIISTMVIYKQTHYILTKETGFDKDQVLLLQGTNTLEDRTKSFKEELLKLSDVKSVSITDFLPISGSKRNGNTFYQEGKTKEDIGVFAQKWNVDYDYIKTLGIKIVEGRNFSRDMASDSAAIIINKAMAEKLGLKDPIGKRITNTYATSTVIGVVDNFNFESMKQDVTPLSMVLPSESAVNIAVKIEGKNVKNAIASISSIWKKFSPNQPVRYTFMDESFANMYADVQRTGGIFTSFAVLAIIIACLGLFALSAFMAEQRNKEIGIRKVLGASITGITAMLSKDFVKLVIIAIVIAAPIAYWAMTKWLQDFAYRISVSWWMIALAAIAAIVIALITISFQSIKAALMNPVKSLRSE